MKIEINKNTEIEIGDLLYSNVHESHCIIFKQIDTGRRKYGLVLIDIENSIEINQSDLISQFIEDDGVELVCKKRDMLITTK